MGKDHPGNQITQKALPTRKKSAEPLLCSYRYTRKPPATRNKTNNLKSASAINWLSNQGCEFQKTQCFLGLTSPQKHVFCRRAKNFLLYRPPKRQTILFASLCESVPYAPWRFSNRTSKISSIYAGLRIVRRTKIRPPSEDGRPYFSMSAAKELCPNRAKNSLPCDIVGATSHFHYS